MKPFFRFFWPATGWFILCTILLTLPGSSFPQENWFSKIQLDKLVHIGLFSVMAILVNWGMFKTTPAEKRIRYFILGGIGCLAYGIVMEFIQRYCIPNRSFDIGDIIADGIGSLCGVLFSSRVYIKK